MYTVEVRRGPVLSHDFALDASVKRSARQPRCRCRRMARMGCIVWSWRAVRHGRDCGFSPVAWTHDRSRLGLVYVVSWIGMLRLAYPDHGANSIGHLTAFRRGHGYNPLRCSDGTFLGGVLDCLFLWFVQTGGRRHDGPNTSILRTHVAVPVTRTISATQEPVIITTCPRDRCRRRT